MAKCPVCDARKGKRVCQRVSGDMVCSLCCGTTREADGCGGCRFYQPPKRDYNAIARYASAEMDRNAGLQAISLDIERALGEYDKILENTLRDEEAITIYELLLDRYHFGDETLRESSGTEIDGAGFINAVLQKSGHKNTETLVKVLAVLRHVAKRRTKIGREYMQVVHDFT